MKAPIIIKSVLTSFALLAAAFLSGCAFTKDYVALSYAPQPDVSKIQGAEAVMINVEVSDLRSTKDRVSVKKNGYGMEMAPIIATNDVAALLKTAIQAELSNRGFNCGGKDVTVAAGLSKFYSDFKTGFFSGSAAAEVMLNVQIKNADGSIAFSNIITGQGANPSLQIMSGENAKIALDAALKDAVSKLMADQSFIDSLLTSGNKARADSSRSS